MRRLNLILLPFLLLVTACARPELEAFRKQPGPLVVSFHASGREGQAVEQEYAAALRARLASRTWVVPEGGAAPGDAVQLDVQIHREARDSRSVGESAKQAGVVTGVAVGVASTLAGNRHGFLDGLFWGLWTAGQVAEERRHERRAWAISPNRVEGVVELRQRGQREPILVLEIGPEEVLRAMDPLKPSEQEDPQRVREEEAKAFARVVVQRLSLEFGWTMAREPMWHRPAGEPVKE